MQPTDPQAKHKIDWWMYSVPVLALLHGLLFLALQARLGPLGVMLWYLGPWLLGWLAGILLVVGLIWSFVRRPFWNRWRLAGYAGLAVIMALRMTYRTYPSSHDNSPSRLEFRLPLDGPVTVGWGGSTPNVNYHVKAPDQRWAYDLLVTEDGKTHRNDGGNLEDYYCYGLPVLAPAAGTVYSTLDGELNLAIGGEWTGKSAAGNHVVLEVAPKQYLFIAHLEPGSIAVAPGEKVVAGQVMGRVGNSGNTSEPHVHVHLQDTPNLHFGEGIPLCFHSYRVGEKYVVRGIPTGGAQDDKCIGQIVEHVPQ